MDIDAALVRRLLREGREREWLEFKEGSSSPEQIGEYASALANGAAVAQTAAAFLVWGIRDSDLAAVGSNFKPDSLVVQKQDLSHWLTTQLKPATDFDFHDVYLDTSRVVVMRIGPATGTPVAFKGVEYIRVASHKKKLREHPDYERRLWQALSSSNFESAPALDGLTPESLVQFLDFPSYFTLIRDPLPENRSQILESLQAEGFVGYSAADGWFISNLGALMLANDLSRFPSVSRKAVRVIRYSGASRIDALREQEGVKGYASGFSGLIQFISEMLPVSEHVIDGIRTEAHAYPPLAVRETVANALIHQDFTISGTGPMVEIFADRIEVTNPGKPLIPTGRFLDSPPRSRNEKVARSMRMMGVCEERGSGWDRIASEIEYHQLPAPLIEVHDAATRVVIFNHRPLTKMDREDRVRAVYLHACLRYVNHENMTNATIRTRFGIPDRNAAQATRLIKEAVEAGEIVPYDATAGPRAMRYLPFWADPARTEL